MKRLLPLAMASALLAAPAVDSDFDGVNDDLDRCPQTPFSELVDVQGCPVRMPALSLVELGAGFGYTTGTYGRNYDTETYAGDLSAAYYGEHFFAGASTAYYFRGSQDVTVSSGDLSSTSSSSLSGLSDLYLNAGYTVDLMGPFELTPSMQLKVPTAEENLGTGRADIGASVQLTAHRERFDLFISAGYLYTGDTGAVKYNNITYGSVGAMYTRAQTWYAGLSLDASESYLPGYDPLISLSLYGDILLGGAYALRLRYSAGQSDTTAKHALGLMLVSRF